MMKATGVVATSFLLFNAAVADVTVARVPPKGWNS